MREGHVASDNSMCMSMCVKWFFNYIGRVLLKSHAFVIHKLSGQNHKVTRMRQLIAVHKCLDHCRNL